MAAIPAAAALLKEISEINSTVRFGRVFWSRAHVRVGNGPVGGYRPVDFEKACCAMAMISDHYGPLLARKYGGKTAFLDEKVSQSAPLSDVADAKIRVEQ